MHTACVWSEKTTVAEYSVIKDPAGAINLRQRVEFVVAASLRWTCRAVASRTVSREAKAGGEYRARTGDLLVANQALSQLS